LAAHAQKIGAFAISALAPTHFKPRSLDVLIAWCAEIAAAAPGTPFYYYDIPSLTGVTFATADLLATAGGRIPTLAGAKFTNPDLAAYQRCNHVAGGRFDVPWGVDEYLLAALALGATGAVGSTYNFAAPLYLRLIDAMRRGDLVAARAEQYRAVQLVDVLAGFGYMAAAKATMGFLGVDVGTPRLPHTALSSEETGRLRTALDALGFFDWVGASPR
ncbi:MAG TPA: dihydrodipicolinate synthase family protein, partial [Tepidisphaeraceae bacterium]|nr:dihydrodipicolinate synthase family protein [Tepidisphaeraceae bacterium]